MDAHLAEAILSREPLSTTRFTALVDQVVHKHAPDAVRRRNDHATRDRGVTIRPDRFQPGRSRTTGHLPHTDAAALNAQLTAIATTAHPGDGRTIDQRRADALLALAHGQRALDCLCPDCTPEPAEQELDAREPGDAPTERDVPEPADKVSADRVSAEKSSATYASADAPETPDRGGKTSERNLKPLCRFHHRIKTFGRWRDHQDDYLAVLFEAPTGHTYLGNAFTGRDLFGALTPRKPPDHPARQRLADERAARTTTHRRQLDEWDTANPPPF
ncbi:DUF222 domain-containing protein [Gordonia amicalis]|uniref:DUF222 domain-containing protein n=1 Tax=Gordonia TaxID=2053 RepID=UPI0035C87E44